MTSNLTRLKAEARAQEQDPVQQLPCLPMVDSLLDFSSSPTKLRSCMIESVPDAWCMHAVCLLSPGSSNKDLLTKWPIYTCALWYRHLWCVKALHGFVGRVTAGHNIHVLTGVCVFGVSKPSIDLWAAGGVSRPRDGWDDGARSAVLQPAPHQDMPQVSTAGVLHLCALQAA